jgi:hypothetical protein
MDKTSVTEDVTGTQCNCKTGRKNIRTSTRATHIDIFSSPGLFKDLTKKNQLLWGSWIQCYRVLLGVCFLLISWLAYPWTLKIEAVCSTVTSVNWLLPDCTAVHSRTQCSSRSVLICFLLDSFSSYSLTLKMEAVYFPWTSVDMYQRIFFTNSVCTCLSLVPWAHTSILNTQAVLSSKTPANIY